MGLFDFFSKKEKTNVCPKCGKQHDKLPGLGFGSPHFYDILSDSDKESMAEISDDFCLITHPDQTDYFIRTVLSIPIINECDFLEYGIWVSVSEKTYNEYAEGFKKEIEPTTYFGAIANEISDYDQSTLFLHTNVNTRNGGIRPEIVPHEQDHQLYTDYQFGIKQSEAWDRVDKAFKDIIG